MKVLLFTHEQDIDGMGSALLADIAFDKYDLIPCKTFEITEKFKNNISNFDQYDQIIVTDLCVKEPILSEINNSKYKNKVIILDHHKTEIEEGNNKYDFVNIVVSSDKGLESGTSLFYEYLLNNNYIKSNKCLDELVELTRQYDTWEWQKNNNNKARQLHIIFESIGYENYLISIGDILNENSLEFTKEQYNIINNYEENLKNDINDILNNMIIYNQEINNINYKIGFVKIPYKYRNELSDIVKSNNKYDIDLVGMIITDRDTVSYRAVKDVDVSKIAVYFGGKGHKAAATNLQSNELFKPIIDLFK